MSEGEALTNLRPHEASLFYSQKWCARVKRAPRRGGRWPEPRLAYGPVGLTKLVAPSVLTVKTESSPWSNDGPLVYKLGLIIVKSSQNKRRVYEATVLIIVAQVRIAVAMTNYSQNA